jgi:hypothetical protein
MTSKPPDFDRALASGRVTAVALGARLIIYLLFEELVRARYHPFLGLVRLRDPLTVRYAGFAAAVLAVIALRLYHGRLVARAARAVDGADAVRLLFRAAVLGLVLAEVPALSGLTLALLAGLNTDFYILEFVSAVLVFMYFPRAGAWESVLEKRRPVCPL